MKVAIPSDNNFVSPHFGRSPFFTIVEIENGRVISKETIDNPGHRAGFLPQFLKEKGVDVVITGGVGVRAQELFFQLGIEVIVGIEGVVDEVIDKFIKGELKSGESLCRPGAGKGYGIGKQDCTHNTHSNHNKMEDLVSHSHLKKKICITSQENTLDSQVDPRFGRCNYFIIYDTENDSYECFPNPNISSFSGAGIASAQFVIDKGVDVVLTGNVGPNALKILEEAGVKVITGASGSIKDIIEKYKESRF